MRLSSVVIRLFVIVTLIFIGFVSIAFAIQINSFEEYYYTRKIQDIDEVYHSFMSLYEGADWNDTLLTQNVRYFENRDNVKIAVVDNHYSVLNEDKYKIFLIDQNEDTYDIELNDIFTIDDYRNLVVNPGDKIEATGYLWGDDLNQISLMRLVVNGIVVYDQISLKPDAGINSNTIQGTVLRVKLPDEDELTRGMNNSEVNEVIDAYYFNPSSIEVFDITADSFIYHESTSSKEYIVKVYKAAGNNIKSIFFMTDQQPIIEATEALKAFYPALITGVFMIGGLLMLFLIFSISNPLYEIEKKAEKLVKFDFTDYLEIKHNDEIGSLSKSLNQLSYNLEQSLKDLSNANDKLKMDLEKDREIEKVRKEFIRNISHDFKTPLGVIRAFAEGLEDGVIEEDTSYVTGIILEEVATLEILVNDMLELSKLQTGGYQIVKELFRMNELIQNIIDKNQRLAEKKGIEFSFVYTEDDLVFADYHKMSRVIQNFVSNAIQYSDENQLILIQTESVTRKLRFEIHNVCEAIPENQLDKLWQNFYRVEISRTKRGGGSGLGLAIAKEILEQHQCDYGVANTSNGIVFHFEMDKNVKDIV